jgi:nucleoside-diphosphate-sugar epimerase
MDNLLTRWVKPYLLEHGEFSYPHRPDLEVSWICLDDVARFMIAAARREDLLGETIDVGGPEALRPPDVADLLSDVLGRPIVYRQITPREFGERLYDVFKDVSGLDRETYASNLERHYLFKNQTNPFLVDMRPVLDRIPIVLTPMREWLRLQDWSRSPRSVVGSVSG